MITLWDLTARKLIGFMFDAEASFVDGKLLHVEIDERIITYTLPCGSPIPAGATCTCNCVPGTFRPVERETPEPKLAKRPVKGERLVEEEVTEELPKRGTKEARQRALQIKRERRLVQQEQYAAQEAAAEMEYYYYMQQFYTPPTSSGGSTTTCICIPVYR